jgi:hypothetical protein
VSGTSHDEGATPASDAPDVAPVDTDGVRTVAVGTGLWALALAVLVVMRDDLEAAGRSWWIWTAVAGVGLGLLGFEYARRRRDAIARVRQYHADHPREATEQSAGSAGETAADSAPQNGRSTSEE